MKVEWMKVSDKQIKKVVTLETVDLPAPQETIASLADLVKGKANLEQRLALLRNKHAEEEKQLESAIEANSEAINEAIKLGITE